MGQPCDLLFQCSFQLKAEHAQYIPKMDIPQFVPRSDTADVPTVFSILLLDRLDGYNQYSVTWSKLAGKACGLLFQWSS